jgi:hypothetical protein
MTRDRVSPEMECGVLCWTGQERNLHLPTSHVRRAVAVLAVAVASCFAVGISATTGFWASGRARRSTTGTYLDRI